MKRQLTILDKNIPSLDLFRLISAFLVVTVHVRPRAFEELIPGISYLVTSVFARAALMYFFALAGFFVAKRAAEKGNATILKYAARTLGTYAIWFAVYAYFDYVDEIKAGLPAGDLIRQVFKDFVFYGGDYHLWFFPALIICCLLFWLFRTIRCTGVWWLLCIPLGAIGLLAHPYRALGLLTPLEPFFQSEIFSPLRRIFFMGMPLFILGGLLYATLDFWMRRPKNLTDALLLISLFGFIIEPAYVNRFELNNGLLITLFLYPLEFFLLLFCIRNPMHRLDRLGNAMRVDASGIYYSHYLFIFLADTFSKYDSAYVNINFSQSPTAHYILVMTLTLLFVGTLRRSNSKILLRLIH